MVWGHMCAWCYKFNRANVGEFYKTIQYTKNHCLDSRGFWTKPREDSRYLADCWKQRPLIAKVALLQCKPFNVIQYLHFKSFVLLREGTRRVNQAVIYLSESNQGTIPFAQAHDRIRKTKAWTLSYHLISTKLVRQNILKSDSTYKKSNRASDRTFSLPI